MPRLILVRHAAPSIDPASPSADWPLSDKGRAAAAELVAALMAYAPATLVSGPEPKMIGTAEAIGGVLGLTNQPVSALAEHARRGTRFDTREGFEASIQALFNRPAEVAYGDESADTTYARFAGAIDGLLMQNPSDPVIAVSGGTAITVFLAKRAGIDPFPFWKALRLPQAFVLSTDGWRLETMIG
jgi:broad specificity phosphatase PhoE